MRKLAYDADGKAKAPEFNTEIFSDRDIFGGNNHESTDEDMRLEGDKFMGASERQGSPYLDYGSDSGLIFPGDLDEQKDQFPLEDSKKILGSIDRSLLDSKFGLDIVNNDKNYDYGADLNDSKLQLYRKKNQTFGNNGRSDNLEEICKGPRIEIKKFDNDHHGNSTSGTLSANSNSCKLTQNNSGGSSNKSPFMVKKIAQTSGLQNNSSGYISPSGRSRWNPDLRSSTSMNSDYSAKSPFSLKSKLGNFKSGVSLEVRYPYTEDLPSHTGMQRANPFSNTNFSIKTTIDNRTSASNLQPIQEVKNEMWSTPQSSLRKPKPQSALIPKGPTPCNNTDDQLEKPIPTIPQESLCFSHLSNDGLYDNLIAGDTTWFLTVGAIGVGKSSYISMCLDPDAEGATPEIGKGTNGTTKRVTSYSTKGFTMVDTPGLNGLKVDPMKYVNGIEGYVNGNNKVNGFILVVGDLVRFFLVIWTREWIVRNLIRIQASLLDVFGTSVRLEIVGLEGIRVRGRKMIRSDRAAGTGFLWC
jgi:hypothetical protein